MNFETAKTVNDQDGNYLFQLDEFSEFELSDSAFQHSKWIQFAKVTDSIFILERLNVQNVTEYFNELINLEKATLHMDGCTFQDLYSSVADNLITAFRSTLVVNSTTISRFDNRLIHAHFSSLVIELSTFSEYI